MNKDPEVVAKAALDAAFKVHTALGPGLLESVYESALAYELTKQSHFVERQKPIPVIYDGHTLEDVGFRADLIIDGCVLLELKSVSQLTETFKKVTTTYLRLTNLPIGFLLNFNEAHLKNGLVRITNGSELKIRPPSRP